jgi:hypothetical protein
MFLKYRFGWKRKQIFKYDQINLSVKGLIWWVYRSLMFVHTVYVKGKYNGLIYCKLKKLINQILIPMFIRYEGWKGVSKEFGIESSKKKEECNITLHRVSIPIYMS